ncbi:hypothetical protein BKG71_23225 [Mycobacteroides chelonae]|nr:hypothetical protein BKG71_23225 [Mycobacteroides chelonae]
MVTELVLTLSVNGVLGAISDWAPVIGGVIAVVLGVVYLVPARRRASARCRWIGVAGLVMGVGLIVLSLVIDSRTNITVPVEQRTIHTPVV